MDETEGIFPSIQAALVTADGGSTAPARLLRREDEKYRLIDLKAREVEVAVDAPWFGAPLVWAGAGLVSLDRDGVATPFEVIHSERSSPVRVRLPGAFYSRLLVGASDFFAVDRLQTIYVRRQHDGWFRITRDREWLPVRGLPNELVLARFDPGDGDVLFGTGHGMYAIGAAGEARKIEGERAPKQAIRAFASSGTSIIAGGDEGLFEIQNDLSDIRPVAHSSAESIGSIGDIFDVSFAGFVIIEASNGTYAYENGTLKRISRSVVGQPIIRTLVVSAAPSRFDHEAPSERAVDL